MPLAASVPLEKHQDDLGRIQQQIDVLQEDLQLRERERERIYAELEQTERDIAALARAGRQLGAMMIQQQQALEQLRQQLVVVRAALAQAQARLAELLRSAYAMGRGDRLRVILNQEDIGRSGRLFGYYRAVSRERARQIHIVDQQAQRLLGLSHAATIEAERLARLADHQEQTRLRLAQAQSTRARIVAELDQIIAAGQDQMDMLHADARSLRELISGLMPSGEIGDELDLQQETMRARKGQLPYPVVPTQVLVRYQSGAAGDPHRNGVLFEAPAGTEVRAVHHGQVVYADWLRGFGLLLVIDHDDGYMSLYGHNQTLLKETGEWVADGEVIALAGVSGYPHTSGLYFALRHRGNPLNPHPWFAAASH